MLLSIDPIHAADIKKHTADENPDRITLEKAIESLKEVMTWVNCAPPAMHEAFCCN